MTIEISDGCLSPTPMSFAFYHNRIIPDKDTTNPRSRNEHHHLSVQNPNSSHLPHTLHRCTNSCHFRFTFDGLPRGDWPYRAYGREHNRSPMHRCTNLCHFGSPLMTIRGETGHTGPMEGNTTAPLCTGVPICAISVHL